MAKTAYQDSALYRLRHSAAHILAMAALAFDPKAKIAIGPPIDNGFYYDFEFSKPATDDDLVQMEKTMQAIIAADFPIEHQNLNRSAAIGRYKKEGQPFKLELAENLPDQELGFYGIIVDPAKLPTELKNKIATFWDLCKGPHVASTGEVKAVKLLSIAGAYWRGDEHQPMLTRIYGTAFGSQKELKTFLEAQEEAKKRDHKKLGKELELFTFSPLVGAGLPLYLPKGNAIREAIFHYISELKRERQYQFVWTPHLAKEQLYETSGHLGKYDAMLPPIVTDDGERFIIKPMNCPHHFQIYNATPHSYRDLPIRMAENATDYRNEKSGELNGLLRVRSLTQDDAHHFVRPDQIAAEIDMVLELTQQVYQDFGFRQYRAQISVRDPEQKGKYFGDDRLWASAEKTLIAAVKRWGVDYEVREGEAAFYGPKIDMMVKDALGREWQLSTVQLDYVQPENFNMTYVDEHGELARPAILHVAILGSLDRFMAITIEHFGGEFPAWLAPIQAQVLPISEKQLAYAREVGATLARQGWRVEVNEANETLGKKIRSGEKTKIPYLLIVGEKEVAERTVSLRLRHTAEQPTVPLSEVARHYRPNEK